MNQTVASSAFSGGATIAPRTEYRMAPHSSYVPGEMKADHYSYEVAKSQAAQAVNADVHSSALMFNASISDRIKAFADVVVKFCAANFPRGNEDAVRKAIQGLRSTPLPTAITIH